MLCLAPLWCFQCLGCVTPGQLLSTPEAQLSGEQAVLLLQSCSVIVSFQQGDTSNPIGTMAATSRTDNKSSALLVCRHILTCLRNLCTATTNMQRPFSASPVLYISVFTASRRSHHFTPSRHVCPICLQLLQSQGQLRAFQGLPRPSGSKQGVRRIQKLHHMAENKDGVRYLGV